MILAGAALLLACCLAIIYAGQVPLDLFGFRQTQTILTSYWFLREGYRIAYETPVGGYPWAIPFEFPLYQYIVAGIVQVSGASLNVVGRLVSFAFLLLCIPAVRSINQRLALPSVVLLYFIALTFTSPVYLYCGRAILIETAALFFAVLAIKFALDYSLGGRSHMSLLMFSISMTVAILQKSTTALPVLLVLAVLLAIGERRLSRSEGGMNLLQWSMLGASLTVPLAAGIGWTHFADLVKEQNPLGQALTSTALATWNWGTTSQRFSYDLWGDVIVMRILVSNLGGLLSIGVFLLAFDGRMEARNKAIIGVAALLGMLPLFLFTNLHIVHDYYQASNIMFIVYAAAVALGAVIAPRFGARAALVFVVLMVVSNLAAFLRDGYFNAMTTSFDRSNREFVMGEILKRELEPYQQFVAFGNDYSSTFAYLSERKSFGVPRWFKDIKKVVENPENYVERGRLGAVVGCGDHDSTTNAINWGIHRTGWKVGEVSSCAIAVPERSFDAVPIPGVCQGSIDKLEAVYRDGLAQLNVLGWSATTGDGERGGDVYLALTHPGTVPIYLDTLRIPHLDANTSLGIRSDDDLGWSRVASIKLNPGEYDAILIQNRGDHAIVCPIHAQFRLIQ